MNTGEDIQALRKIAEFTRMISIAILSIHIYLSCYQAFEQWELTATFSDRIVSQIAKLGIFEGFWKAKGAALLLLIISIIGIKGKKEEKIEMRSIIAYQLTGVLVYSGSSVVFYLPGPTTLIAVCYVFLTGTGYLLFLTGCVQLGRLLRDKIKEDVFNEENETSPQE